MPGRLHRAAGEARRDRRAEQRVVQPVVPVDELARLLERLELRRILSTTP